MSTVTAPRPAGPDARSRARSGRPAPHRSIGCLPRHHAVARRGATAPGRPVRRGSATARSAAEGYGHYRYSGYSAVDADRYTAVLPGRSGVSRGVAPRATRRTTGRRIEARRRVVAALVFVLTCATLWLGAGSVLASRGGDPASAPAARPGATVHVVVPGDTLWSIAEQHRGERSIRTVLDELIAANGGTTVLVGQSIVVP